ncbi:MAG: hypothetical protein ACR2QT_14770 [Woeseiaceae bacterium]
MKNHIYRLLICPALIVLTACSEPAEPVAELADSDYQKQLQTQLIQAQPGDVIFVPEGVHRINRGLSLNVSGVTLRGPGMDRRDAR